MVRELPPESAFWRGVMEPLHEEQERKRVMQEQRAEARKRLGLGPPPSFRHRRR